MQAFFAYPATSRLGLEAQWQAFAGEAQLEAQPYGIMIRIMCTASLSVVTFILDARFIACIDNI